MAPGLLADFEQKLDLERLQIGRHLARFDRELRHRSAGGRMREREPVHWSEKAQAWYFTRYYDVFELQDRPDLSVDRIETLYS